jgi:hypothetical protein
MKQSFKLNESVGGFREGEILDVTARFGDWHEYDLKFTPVSGSTSISAGGIVELTAEELGEVAEPIAAGQ